MQIRKQKTGQYQSCRLLHPRLMTEPAKRHAPVPRPDRVEYAPAPRRARSSPEKRYGLFIGGKFVKPRSGEWFPSDPLLERVRCSREMPRPARRTSASPSRVSAARTRTAGRSCRCPSGRSTCSGSRASCRSLRELAVLESLDGGKPIRESRDVDLLLAAAHFPTTRAGPTSSSTRSRTGSRSRSASPARSSPGTSRSPCWPGRSPPRPAAGNTVVLGPAETTPLSALFADVCRQAEPAGRRQHRHGRRPGGRGARQARGRGRDRLDGPTTSARRSSASSPARTRS